MGGSALALSLGRLAGLLAGSALIGQLLLAARLPVLERWVGLDGLLGWHRRNGTILVTLVVLHATLVIAASQRLFDQPSPSRALLTLMASRPGVTLTVVAGTLIGLIGFRHCGRCAAGCRTKPGTGCTSPRTPRSR